MTGMGLVRTPVLVGLLALLTFVVLSLLPPAVHPAVQAALSAGRVAPTTWTWPLVPTPAVVRPFAPPPSPWLAGHRGVDLAGSVGQLVRSAGPGVVAFAGQVAGRPLLSVDHAAGLRTTYEPVEPSVPQGRAVAAGDTLGVLVGGHPGCPVAACLHWGLRRGETYLDPLLLVRTARMRLKPLSGQPPNAQAPAAHAPMTSTGSAVAETASATAVRPATAWVWVGAWARAEPVEADRVAPRPAGRSPPGGCRPAPTGAGTRDRSRWTQRPQNRDPARAGS